MNLDYIAWRSTIGEVLDTRYYTLEWLDDRVRDGSAIVWATATAIIIAEVKEYPTGATNIHGLVAAGDVDVIVSELIPEAEHFGRQIGCIAALIDSREGWARTLANSGYSLYKTAVRKELN